MPHLTAQCARCQAGFAIKVEPQDILKRSDRFYALDWQVLEVCDCNESEPQVHGGDVDALLDRHPDAEREWAEGRSLRSEAARERRVEWKMEEKAQ